ncbi:hypothetical protein PG985_007379 [Apiospora marii]|uniref:Uncharacterized protein n=1 Tax=Apiospora marii TaxID=335849 RepID=A0ABR1SNR1_9PEZI
MDAYKRAGRGGAGNYYSPQQIEEATSKGNKGGPEQQEDLEAQNPAVDVDPPPSDPAAAAVSAPPPSSAGGYARSGRGGAGNFVTNAEAADAEHHQAQAAMASSRAASYANAHAPSPSHQHQQQQQQQLRYSGRGGAGNWTSDPAQVEYDEENRRKRQAALDAKVFDEVNTVLAEPKKAYQLHPAGHIGRGRVGVAGQGGGGDVDGTDI